jgi:hypothetical protein
MLEKGAKYPIEYVLSSTRTLREVTNISPDGREETLLPFRCSFNTRTPERNPLKYLQSKNEYKFYMGIEHGTFCMANKHGKTGLTVPLISRYLTSVSRYQFAPTTI